MNDNLLNAQQIQQIQKHAQDQIEAYIHRLQLRKWAVEQAFSMISSSTNEPRKPGDAGITYPMALAEAIYNFTVQPLKLDLTPQAREQP